MSTEIEISYLLNATKQRKQQVGKTDSILVLSSSCILKQEWLNIENAIKLKKITSGSTHTTGSTSMHVPLTAMKGVRVQHLPPEMAQDFPGLLRAAFHP